MSINPEYWEKHPKEAEFDADAIVYDIPDERKAALFAIVEREIYQLDMEEGNAVYQYFCWIYDVFIEKFPEYKKKGKLDGVIYNELRKGK